MAGRQALKGGGNVSQIEEMDEASLSEEMMNHGVDSQVGQESCRGRQPGPDSQQLTRLAFSPEIVGEVIEAIDVPEVLFEPDMNLNGTRVVGMVGATGYDRTIVRAVEYVHRALGGSFRPRLVAKVMEDRCQGRQI
jgi:hypothetical protein